jgi:hypothetical protein
MERKDNEGSAINDSCTLETVIYADASSILTNYLRHGLINTEGVGGIEKMFEACVEGLLEAAAYTASQSNLSTDEVIDMLNRKLQERGVKPTETARKS